MVLPTVKIGNGKTKTTQLNNSTRIINSHLTTNKNVPCVTYLENK